MVPYAPATDDNGEFRFERVPPGGYRVNIAVYPEHGWQVAQSATNGLLLITATGPPDVHKVYFEAPEIRGGISGRMVASGSGASVEVFAIKVIHVDAPGATGSRVHGRAFVNGARLPLTPSQAASWTQGSFLIEGISPGLATLEITAAGYAPDTAQIPVMSGTTTNVTIALKPEGTLRGDRRRDKSGPPSGPAIIRPAEAWTTYPETPRRPPLGL